MTVKESKGGERESCLDRGGWSSPRFFSQWLFTTAARDKRAQCITDQVLHPGSVVDIEMSVFHCTQS